MRRRASVINQVLAAPGDDSNFCQVPQAGAQLISIIDLRDDMSYEILPFFEIDVKVGIFESVIG